MMNEYDAGHFMFTEDLVCLFQLAYNAWVTSSKSALKDLKKEKKRRKKEEKKMAKRELQRQQSKSVSVADQFI